MAMFTTLAPKGMRLHDGMVQANRGFQDKMFKMYTGQALHQESSSIGGSKGVDRFGIPRGSAAVNI
eukprot:CAMPEP_0180144114 /NCGR_PEP_ID=MMETSP0986-20121125/16687_1 /TAXON_ID=697907 /ORGANISM="non described non described, Strain CCMP2293" /LENGTH=65 /DNA_ID=CAMNT_0022087849 /DNA_START=45 /DNA_END=242 /DNA_ORIENTATION=+